MLIFVDGRNQIFRNHHVSKMLTRADGHPTGAVYGCLNNSLLALARRLPEASFVWVWDGVGETWRHRMMAQLPQLDTTQFEEEETDDLPSKSFQSSMVNNSLEFLGVFKQPTRKKKPRIQGYKAQRQKKIIEAESEAKKKKSKWPEDGRNRALIQMPILRLILEQSGFRQFEVQGLEGDDLLAMLVVRAIELDPGIEIAILSGDRDYYQLLKYPQVRITKGLKEGKISWITGEDVKSEYGISPKKWTLFRAFTGDSSDNIPRLHKCGEKTALKLIADGFNPSNPDVSHIPQESAEKYAKLFPFGLERMWPAVHGNWKLCELVSSPDSSLLSPEVRENLGHIFDKLTSIRKFRRRESCKTPENFRKVSYLLGNYELNNILSQRDLLWQIP